MEPSQQHGPANDAVSRAPFLHVPPSSPRGAERDRAGDLAPDRSLERTWRAADALRTALWRLTESEDAVPIAITAARRFVGTLHEHGATAAQVEAALEIAIADVFADLLASQPGDEIAELDFAERAHLVVTTAFAPPRAD